MSGNSNVGYAKDVNLMALSKWYCHIELIFLNVIKPAHALYNI